ncbi:carboxypeptidase-like regulatory domain-containing protein [Sabulilitoribacter arenilitoris]|uniref:Carboxypeptidase-like regulatory domain-containing protein n=1 Tax=Wocania arenilitoris TaxID=2044858 RepID=A0AAE3JJU1_9FLAO|nr:carboxypeptidase-like regulatory domain-containing protein [Wocania arenilitoris]MCF7567398.1 carboxypeptidase-like regulatory domain-containing protein [Wocania arenilitoris]
MRKILLIAIFFVTAFSFAQQTGSVQGYLLDLESNNEPLIYAKVVIKETGSEALSDEKGLFKFDNLKAGKYTLVSSFVGYETKESTIKVINGKSINIKLHLKADSISIDDLMLTLASTDKKDTAINK